MGLAVVALVMRVISADRHDFVEVFAGLGPMYYRTNLTRRQPAPLF
jgi:hypothetical protein